jgi:hypothetical protein
LSWTHGPDSDFPTILSVDLPLWTPEPDNTENPLT